METITQAKLTCPRCGYDQILDMPSDACQFFYECVNCKTVFPGECSEPITLVGQSAQGFCGRAVGESTSGDVFSLRLADGHAPVMPVEPRRQNEQFGSVHML